MLGREKRIAGIGNPFFDDPQAGAMLDARSLDQRFPRVTRPLTQG